MLVEGSVTGAGVSGCVSGVVVSDSISEVVADVSGCVIEVLAGVSGCVIEVVVGVSGCNSEAVVGVIGCDSEVVVGTSEISPHPVQVHCMSIFDCTACLYSSWEMPVWQVRCCHCSHTSHWRACCLGRTSLRQVMHG